MMTLEEVLANSDYRRYAEYLAYGLSALFALLCLVAIYHTVLIFMPGKDSMTSSVSGDAPPTVNKLPDISEYHLFGFYQPTSLDEKNLPKTTLNLTLIGVFSSFPQEDAYAVIAVPGGEQKLFKVGDVITGNAKIYRILEDSVVIERNGKLEVLTLPKQKINFGVLPQGLSNM